MTRRLNRAERRESKRATRRLRAFRALEVNRLRTDALRFTLSEAVTMASLRREAGAIVGPEGPSGRLHMHAGVLLSVDAGGWSYAISGTTVQARRSAV